MAGWMLWESSGCGHQSSVSRQQKGNTDFLRNCEFLHIHILFHKIVKIVGSLCHVTRESNDFSWDSKQQQVLDKLNRRLCSSLWATQDRVRCEKCALRCNWESWSFLESLTKSTHGDLKTTPEVLDLLIKRIWGLLHPNWRRDLDRLWRGWHCLRSDWHWSTALSGTQTVSAGLDVQGKFPS